MTEMGSFAASPLFSDDAQMQPFRMMTGSGRRADAGEPRLEGRLTLRGYVQQHTGVPLGHRDSMRNMLDRSLGAADFGGFWRHWNPIWSNALARYVMAPRNRTIPFPAALVATFAVSGLLHDLVIMAMRGELALLFTP